MANEPYPDIAIRYRYRPNIRSERNFSWPHGNSNVNDITDRVTLSRSVMPPSTGVANVPPILPNDLWIKIIKLVKLQEPRTRTEHVSHIFRQLTRMACEEMFMEMDKERIKVGEITIQLMSSGIELLDKMNPLALQSCQPPISSDVAYLASIWTPGMGWDWLRSGAWAGQYQLSQNGMGRIDNVCINMHMM